MANLNIAFSASHATRHARLIIQIDRSGRSLPSCGKPEAKRKQAEDSLLPLGNLSKVRTLLKFPKVTNSSHILNEQFKCEPQVHSHAH